MSTVLIQFRTLRDGKLEYITHIACSNPDTTPEDLTQSIINWIRESQKWDTQTILALMPERSQCP